MLSLGDSQRGDRVIFPQGENDEKGALNKKAAFPSVVIGKLLLWKRKGYP